MDKIVEEEILYNIMNSFDQQVDNRQLLNQVEETSTDYTLRAYGLTLNFNSDGDIV